MMTGEERIATAAAYMPIAGRILLFFLPCRKSPGVRFHLFQSLLVTGAAYVAGAALALFRELWIVQMAAKALAAADLLLCIGMSVMALLARPLALPVLGRLARKLAGIQREAVRPELS